MAFAITMPKLSDHGEVLPAPRGRSPGSPRRTGWWLVCDLQGLPQAQAASQLRWSERTVRYRLSEGRERLGRRLTRRGLVLSSSMIGALLSREASAAVPAAWRETAIRAALAAAEHVTTACAVSSAAGDLASEALRSMFLCNVRTTLVATIACLAVATGAVVLGRQAPGAQGQQVQSKQPSDQEKHVAKGGNQSGQAIKRLHGVLDPSRAKESLTARHTTQLALAAHAEAAAIDKLPRFSYQVRYRHGHSRFHAGRRRFYRSAQAGADRTGPRTRLVRLVSNQLLMDEQRFLWEMAPGDTVFNGHDPRSGPGPRPGNATKRRMDRPWISCGQPDRRSCGGP